MKRYEAIECISEAILNDGLVDALFLKGSIARNEDDDYSDVDMYAVVSPENWDLFLKRRIGYMETYMPLVFWQETDFVGPQIVGVFENILHFDLFAVKKDALPQTDAIKVLFDKNNLLESYKQLPQNLSVDTIIDAINEFAFTLLEFSVAYSRGDVLWAIRLFHMQVNRVALFTRFVYDEASSQLGLKRLYKIIPETLYQEYTAILENATPVNIGMAMKQLVDLADRIIVKLPESVTQQINHDFYDLMRKEIHDLH